MPLFPKPEEVSSRMITYEMGNQEHTRELTWSSPEATTLPEISISPRLEGRIDFCGRLGSFPGTLCDLEIKLAGAALAIGVF
eukprot:586996-Amorphochlora_amoeboformis.AAC.1